MQQNIAENLGMKIENTAIKTENAAIKIESTEINGSEYSIKSYAMQQ